MTEIGKHDCTDLGIKGLPKTPCQNLRVKNGRLRSTPPALLKSVAKICCETIALHNRFSQHDVALKVPIPLFGKPLFNGRGRPQRRAESL